MAYFIVEITRAVKIGQSNDPCFVCEATPRGGLFSQAIFTTPNVASTHMLGRMFDQARAYRTVVAELRQVTISACPKHEDRLEVLIHNTRDDIGLNTILQAMGPYENACSLCGFVLQEDNRLHLTILIEDSDDERHYLDLQKARICDTCSGRILERVESAGSRSISVKRR